MLRIHRFFELQFASKEISRAELLDFTQDHLGRLSQQNEGGQYDGMLTQTSAAYEAFGGTVSNEVTADAIGKARTAAKEAHFQLILTRLSGLAGTLHGQFGKESVEYIEFFPRGLTEVREAREAEIEAILDRVVSAAETYLPASAAELTTLRTRWIDVYQAATSGRAAATGANDSRDTAKADLQLQLTRNVLQLALEYVAQPDKAALFFDESRLHNAKSSSDPSVPDEPILDEPLRDESLPGESL